MGSLCLYVYAKQCVLVRGCPGLLPLLATPWRLAEESPAGAQHPTPSLVLHLKKPYISVFLLDNAAATKMPAPVMPPS